MLCYVCLSNGPIHVMLFFIHYSGNRFTVVKLAQNLVLRCYNILPASLLLQDHATYIATSANLVHFGLLIYIAMCNYVRMYVRVCK